MSVNSLDFYNTPINPLKSLIEFVKQTYLVNVGKLLDDDELFKLMGARKDEVSEVSEFNELLKKSGLYKLIY